MRFASPTDVAAVHAIFAVSRPNFPVANEYLVHRTGLSLRVIRDAIAKLVQAGMPIISNRKRAYVLCTDPAVLFREMRSLRSHSRETELRAHGLRDYLVRTGYATGIDEEDYEAEMFGEMAPFSDSTRD